MYNIDYWLLNYTEIYFMYSSNHVDVFEIHRHSTDKKFIGIDINVENHWRNLRDKCIVVINDLYYRNKGIEKILLKLEKNNRIVYLDYGKRDEWKENKSLFISDDDEIEIRNKIIVNALQNTYNLRVVCNRGTDITFDLLERKVFEENKITMLSNNVITLPYGEVCFPVKENTANGHIVWGTKMIKIISGYICLNNKPSAVPLCEFGVGTNSSILDVEQYQSYEKTFGTCHFGFGRNIDFGGTIDLNFHFDIVVPRFNCMDSNTNSSVLSSFEPIV